MISFLILIVLYAVPTFYFLFNDIKKNKIPLWQVIVIILLVLAIYLKSINL